MNFIDYKIDEKKIYVSFESEKFVLIYFQIKTKKR